jgi:hypothetical protein
MALVTVGNHAVGISYMSAAESGNGAAPSGGDGDAARAEISI